MTIVEHQIRGFLLQLQPLLDQPLLQVLLFRLIPTIFALELIKISAHQFQMAEPLPFINGHLMVQIYQGRILPLFHQIH